MCNNNAMHIPIHDNKLCHGYTIVLLTISIAAAGSGIGQPFKERENENEMTCIALLLYTVLSGAIPIWQQK